MTAPIDGKVGGSSLPLAVDVERMHVYANALDFAIIVASEQRHDHVIAGKRDAEKMARAIRAAATEITELRAESATHLEQAKTNAKTCESMYETIATLRTALSETQQDNKKMAQDRDDDLTEMEQMERDLAEAQRKAEALQAVIDQHDLCHNLHGKVDARAFADGCAAEQRKLYGCAPDADALAELRDRVEALEDREGSRGPQTGDRWAT